MTSNRPQRKKATLADIAAEVNVTPATASLALSGKGNISPATRQAVRQAARRLNYQPNPHAQSLSSGRSTNKIALFSQQMDLGVATYKLQIIQRLLAEQGYEIPAYLYGYCAPAEVAHQVELLRSLCNQNPQAIVCNIETLDEQSLIELRRYQEAGGVLLTYDFEIDLDCDRVLFDREDNTYQATRHLLELGHRDLGLCMPGHAYPSGPRLQGFCRAMREVGALPHSEWLFGSQPHGYRGGIYEEAGVQLAQQIMQMKNPPTGVCVLDDNTASACAAEFERGGWHVPADISIVGHDDAPIARYGYLPLTTVVHPAEAIVHNVIELLRDRLRHGPDEPVREVVLRGPLVVRHSTAAPHSTKKKVGL